MAGMHFEYDEEGGTFFYFLLSFWTLVLVPSTFYYFWPKEKSTDTSEKQKRICNCEPCQVKRNCLKSDSKWQKVKHTIIKFGFVIGWIILVLLAYKVSKIQMDYVEYDPYQELGIDRGATQAQIKKAYKQMSLKYHPDKHGGEEKKFILIAKAYAALTDEETKKNWEEHGNPDGPGVTRFGIALPKWIVERENSMWVLAAYGLVFMIILPVVVGVWWYRSIKFSKDQVLLNTTRLYYYFFQKVPNMLLKRVIMVLGASFEFDRMHNAEIVERPSDNEEVPQLMKRLSNLEEKNKEKPLCFPYSVKARALLHAHFNRLDLPPNTLEIDQQYILAKCPYLLNEMINIIAQLVSGAARNAVQHMPRLETLENTMKVSQMLFQALDQRASPLLQLPHVSADMLKHFTTKKRNIQRITDLIAMKEDDRKALFRNLSNNEYKDIMSVCASLPHIVMDIRSEVLDDDDSTITAGSIVTVTVKLRRQPMDEMFEDGVFDVAPSEENTEELENEKEENENQESSQAVESQPAKQVQKSQPAKKQPKNKKAAKKKKAPKQAYNWKAAAMSEKETASKQNATAQSGAAEDKPENDNSEIDSEEDEEDTNVSEVEEVKNKNTDNNKVEKQTKEVQPEDDDEQWQKYQEEVKTEIQLESKSKESHPVHCPYFPEEKQEGWWLYVADKKSHMLITAPVQILTLKHEEEVVLKFSAPMKPNVYNYSVILRSDCYLDFDQSQKIRLDVKEAKVIEDHPQWDISDDEDKEKEDDSDSDYSTDMDESDYE